LFFHQLSKMKKTVHSSVRFPVKNMFSELFLLVKI